MSTIISGNIVRDEICSELRERIEKLKVKNIVPTLVIIQVGNNEASNAYIRNKIRLSEKLKTNTIIKKLPSETTQQELIDLIKQLNNDKKINGIIVQLPLPKHINEAIVTECISPLKDVDCFHNENVGKL
jgi:methylenetetrahydrofolate dehydrogenase (NADP+)/methenyltetrahydrofolate cyclohydrolase